MVLLEPQPPPPPYIERNQVTHKSRPEMDGRSRRHRMAEAEGTAKGNEGMSQCGQKRDRMAEAEAKGLELDGPDGIGRRMAEAKGTGWLVEGTGPDGRDGRDGWQRRKGPDG